MGAAAVTATGVVRPDAMVANSLTNDTLTEWGGGAVFSDTLVEVAAF
jgi:hypothetical protein